MSALDDMDKAKSKSLAESLQRQIADLKAGRSKPAERPSLRDFIERTMVDDRKKAKKETR